MTLTTDAHSSQTQGADDIEIQQMLNRLTSLLRRNLPENEVKKCLHAYEFAKTAHGDQRRNDGTLFITHPLEVAILLADLELDWETIAAGLLHDTDEDTPTTYEELKEEFGERIANMVQGVTKVGDVDLAYKEEAETENLRRMLVATAEDLHVIVIKLCDRLHNMRTLQFLRPDKRRRIAQATLDIYAPLAHRLGLGEIKWELEDLSLSFLHPEVYQDIKAKVAQKRRDRKAYVNEVCELLQTALIEQGIGCQVVGRPKHFYSIYRKMKRDSVGFEELTDLLALRVVTGTVAECYAALGVVHSMWRPREGKFKDYIANPKPNNYRSLHTTVFGPSRRVIEIQIRTRDMHLVAERGIAAHWRYKEGSEGARLGKDAKWLEGLPDQLPDTLNPEEFVESIKRDLFADEVYIYTPKGKLLRMPLGSTPIDFAYRIHTDLGNRCAEAHVNGRIVPLNYELQTGDTVEIVTSKRGMASASWLEVVRTSGAKAKIRKYLLDTQHDELLQRGQTMLDRELQRNGIVPSEFYKSESCKKYLKSLRQRSVEELHINIGFGRVSTKQILARVIQERRTSDEKPVELKTGQDENGTSAIVRLGDIDNILYRRARCCAPLPGDNIVGFVTRGRGITIHRRDCRNIRQLHNEPHRIMNLFWERSSPGSFSVDVEIAAKDRQRLLSDLSHRIAGLGISIEACHTVTDKEGVARMLFTLSIGDRSQLDNLMQNLVGIEGVHYVRRKRGTLSNSEHLHRYRH